MPRVYDNIDKLLRDGLTQSLGVATSADFCVGYFNLRGWRMLEEFVERWPGGADGCCRLLVGMQTLPSDELRRALSLSSSEEAGIDTATAERLRKEIVRDFRRQLTLGAPTNEDERGLRRLCEQIRAGKVQVRLFLRFPLHAKLYLVHRPNDPNNPTTGFVGSSNLTLAGLAKQGELNVDVLDHDACEKLQTWFEARWEDQFCYDIADDLVQTIDESWAGERPIPPFHIYLKMAYHLSQEARAGLAEFAVPSDIAGRLLEFQTAAVQIAAHHLNRRGGVMIGDVVGLGKTVMASALARTFEDDFGLETLIICPKNLEPMWRGYVHEFRLRAEVLSSSLAIRDLPQMRRYRLVIIDESHNLRNRDGQRYRAISEYIRSNDSRVILLTATPYNKTYTDLANQLRLFVPEEADIGIRPEALLRELGSEAEFSRKHQCPVRSLAAFDKSPHADDWRDLMRLYLVRRTRSFIIQNYAETDPDTGRYVTFGNGERSYFPTRVPRNLPFAVDDADRADQYARLYRQKVVRAINGLHLPRYGLGQYADERPASPPSREEEAQLADLSRAGKRLMGFCRTNLFKRMESSGAVFLKSVERHVLRNFVFLHAIEAGEELPIGTQDAELLDARINDEDESPGFRDESEHGDDVQPDPALASLQPLRSEGEFRAAAQAAYEEYRTAHHRRFAWLRADLFSSDLGRHLEEDARALMGILSSCGAWDPARDTKLDALCRLLTETHPDEKVLVFTQFADTVQYIASQLQARGIEAVAGVTGKSEGLVEAVSRFSPDSNHCRVPPEEQLRALIATDVLSEGLNLQDAHVVVNYDLPWAIIRLIQRAGRVDRIGQRAERILCYTFGTAEGVERILRLRRTVRKRLVENAEVVGADESFFEDDPDDRPLVDLYSEKAGILDGEDDTEVDLASYAYQIWRNATDGDPSLRKAIEELPSVIYSARAQPAGPQHPHGVLVYLQTGEGNDALAWIDERGEAVTHSQIRILQAAQCEPDTPAAPRTERHHELVRAAVTHIAEQERAPGGQLGRPSGARFRTYERLKRFADRLTPDLFWSVDRVAELKRAIDEIHRHPIHDSAKDALNRQLKSGIGDERLADLVLTLREQGRLCIVHDDGDPGEPRIICSLGLVAPEEGEGPCR